MDLRHAHKYNFKSYANVFFKQAIDGISYMLSVYLEQIKTFGIFIETDRSKTNNGEDTKTIVFLELQKHVLNE